ncbi:MAG: sugar phosphate isomerase/epimerase [Defluviitaleaceae bacterium]|nr:sugar phosphate isomerase/epimerase [Defluviitaleaceae bacterium]
MKFGAQLYTIRDYMHSHKEFANSIKKISKLGFECVQISGVDPIVPVEEIAETCKAYGLEIAITHTNPKRIMENTKEVILDHKLMGCNYVGIGMIPNEYERSKSGFMKFALDFTPAARALKEEGMQLMYHNHHIEFEKYEGKLVMDFIREVFREVNFTLDTYWVQAGGADPAHWIRKLDKRVEVLHLKDFAVFEGISRMCEVMEGNLNWVRIMNAAKDVGVKYAMIEQDECYGKDPFECLGTSLFNIRNKLSEYEFESDVPQEQFKPQYIDRKLSSDKDEIIW